MELENLIMRLEKHLKWLSSEDGGERADLRGADLRGADLRMVILRAADLRGADLRGADLSGAILRAADLSGADLSGAILRGADLRGATLKEADLRGADLRMTLLIEANLRVADLRGADLKVADLSRSILRVADFSGADLSGAVLREAEMPSELVTKFFPLACPEFGEFIGWKKARAFVDGSQEQVIIKLQVPEDARRSSAFGRKCRCDKAVVVAIENMDGGISKVNSAISDYDPTFFYRVGETVSVDNFDTDRTNECAHGIHFFITRQEAVDY